MRSFTLCLLLVKKSDYMFQAIAYSHNYTCVINITTQYNISYNILLELAYWEL
jgi:hypothetical protein